MKSPVYLIPYDFSPVSEDALRLGIDLARHNEGSVMLLHFAGRKTDVKEAKDRFSEITGKLPETDRGLVVTRVLVGNVYENISMAGELINASLIVMGTHGAKGLQKLFGSHALRLVSSTHIPFLITQGGRSEAAIKTIVMPYYFERESMQIASFAGYIAKQFNATIHLVGSTPKDDWNKEHMNANRIVLHKFFSDHHIQHELVNLPSDTSYEKALIDYADSVHADLIAVSYHNQSLLPTMHTFVQALIENEKQIPVLTVNTEDLTITSGYFFIST